MRIAIIGGGISGLTAGAILASSHDVHLFEAEGYLGGHTNTFIFSAFGQRYAVDTGFMVFNDRTYPNFRRLLDHLGVTSRKSDMSFGVRCDRTGLEYQGSSLNGIFAQRLNLLRPRFLIMLWEILRFNRRARAWVESGGSEGSLNSFLQEHRFREPLREWYLVPMGAAIWSVPPGQFLNFPARFVIGFFYNHGLLSVRGHFEWKTIEGGACRYVEALTRPWRHRIRLSSKVRRIKRSESDVCVSWCENEEKFDAVVLAGHADQMLELLSDADPLEREILAAFPYQTNRTTLHTDQRMLPRSRRAWASWNYRIPIQADRPALLTYHLNRLQGHESPEPLCITLNGDDYLSSEKIIARWDYAHPLFSAAASAAQRRYGEINGHRRTYYCGAYWSNGFHEDGVNSALAVARALGVSPSW